nr:DUF4251 domain-containing protein [uncultured Alistipes sp.]
MKKLFLLLALSFWAAGLSAQKKQSAEDVKIMQAINQLISTKAFTFHANKILSSNAANQASFLTHMNTLQVTKDSVVVRLPYVGQAFISSDFGNNKNPLSFTSKDFTYDLQSNKRGDRIITMDVKSPHGSDRLTFTIVVGQGINAKLIVNQISRSTMQFSGYIQGNETPENN